MDKTKERVIQTQRYTRGLVRYVTNGQPLLVTITSSAGLGGTISPAGVETANYGDTPSFMIIPDSGYTIEDVKVNGDSKGSISSYTFEPVIADNTISATFKQISLDWVWSRDGWGDWQHTWSVSGTQIGPNSEYGPVQVDDHWEHGTTTNLLAGSTKSSVWRMFTDASGSGWNTITFVGALSPCDVPDGRWIKIDVNGQQVFAATELQTPPGNSGQPFEIKASFTPSSTALVTISQGQNPAWGPGFTMSFYSIRLSKEKTLTAMAKSDETPFVIPDGSGLATNVTTSGNSVTP